MAALDITHTTPPPAEWVRVGDLQPWERNPKAHPTENVAEIARSIVRFGFTEPLIVWRSQKRVVAGHGRLLAAQMLYREDPGRKLATDQPGDAPEAAEDGLVPVRWMEFANEREAAAYAVVDNRLTEKNPMDPGLVAEIFADLEQNGVSLDGLGYDDVELDALMSMEEPTESVEPTESDDEAPAVDESAPPDSQPGQVYELGPHRLVCGDSTTAEAWVLLMGDQKGDLVFTDPPYGVAYEGGHNEKKRRQIVGDALEGGDLTGLFHDSLSMAVAHTHNHAAFYVWFASGKSIETFAAFGKLPLKLRAVLQWYKVRSGLGAFMAQYIPNCEPCIYAFKEGSSPQWFGPSDEKTVWELQREGRNEFHPTQKPVELSVRAISNSSKPGQVVIDMFGGSGATLIGCGVTGRVCRMIEIDPKYCDVIRRRWTRWAKEHGKPVGSGGLE